MIPVPRASGRSNCTVCVCSVAVYTETDLGQEQSMARQAGSSSNSWVVQLQLQRKRNAGIGGPASPAIAAVHAISGLDLTGTPMDRRDSLIVRPPRRQV